MPETQEPAPQPPITPDRMAIEVRDQLLFMCDVLPRKVQQRRMGQSEALRRYEVMVAAYQFLRAAAGLPPDQHVPTLPMPGQPF